MGFSWNDSFLFPGGFLDYWRFSLEVIWGQSPLKFRLNNFEDPVVARADIVDCSMIKVCYLSCLYRMYMLINKYDGWRLVHGQAKTHSRMYMLINKYDEWCLVCCTARPKPQWCYVLCMWERIARRKKS